MTLKAIGFAGDATAGDFLRRSLKNNVFKDFVTFKEMFFSKDSILNYDKGHFPFTSVSFIALFNDGSFEKWQYRKSTGFYKSNCDALFGAIGSGAVFSSTFLHLGFVENHTFLKCSCIVLIKITAALL